MTMIPTLKFIALIFFIVATAVVNANENCELFRSTDTPDITDAQYYHFENKTLVCANNIGFKSSKYDYQVIRTHIYELEYEKILASVHGYHLITGKINCDTTHCNHIDIINLDDFRNIQQVKIDKGALKGNSITQSMVNQIDANLWLDDGITLSSWSRISGSTDNNNAKVWIENKMNALGLQVSTPAFSVLGNTTHNIIGIQSGSTRVNDWYIVGAHMDSTSSFGAAPGAVDNASGCAGVLEIARVASLYSFEATIFFICYSGEEQGLIGSYNHVNSIINAGDQNKVKAALILDMIGYTSNSDNDLLLESSVANQWLINILAQNAATYVPNLNIFTSTNPFGSDHVPYINNNMGGILSIDDDWNVYPAYHQSNDLPENLNLTQGEYILQTNIASLVQLAGILGATDLIFVNGFE